MKLRWAGDDKILRGITTLDCLRYHCRGDHSPEARRGDIDAVMKRLAGRFQLDIAYSALPTLEERADAFVATAIRSGWLEKIS